MNDRLQFLAGIFVPLFVVMATFIGTMVVLGVFHSWGLLVFLTWPLIAVFIVWFVMWWDEL